MNDLEKITYNCRKATFLIEKKELGSLTAREKLELKIHMAGCSVCRLFQKQSVLINQMVRDVFHTKARQEAQLDEDFKIELQHMIEEKLNKN